MTEPRPYVLAWKLAGRRVLVVGGGNIGTAKIETFTGTGARLIVVDPTPSERVLELAAAGDISLRQRRFRPHDLFGVSLVVAATGESRTNRRIRRWARLARVLVNAVDDPAYCDVTVPAVVVRGPATVAITTGGATPAGARFLRETLTDAVEATLPAATGELLEAASELRAELRHHGGYRYDYRAWKNHLFEPGLNAGHRGRSITPVVDAFLDRFAANAPAPVGRVTLVGAGPGGVDLITMRGANALAKADVVVYDRLAEPRLLDLAPVAAERIPVGKGKGHGATQSEINALLIERAYAGDHVVRLKGGDPYVFGRGGEEVDALAAAGIAVDVVPGLSSALAAPALAGIALTDRRASSAFTVVTGHRARIDDELVALQASEASTLVVLMAASTADEVARQLVENGWDRTSSAAFVHAAGTPRQQQTTLDLASVIDQGCPFASPTVMVVGPTVDRAQLNRSESSGGQSTARAFGASFERSRTTT